MNILLVVYDNDSHLTCFPMGLAYLASAARNAGHQVSVYQQDIYHWPDRHLTEYIDSHSYDIVVVSVIAGYYQYRKLQTLSAAINQSSRRATFRYLIGGHGPAASPEFFLRKTGADFAGIGEGEITFVELMEALEKGKDPAGVDGIAFIDRNGQYIKTRPRALIKHVDDIAMPAYDLFDITYYALQRDPNIQPNERCMQILSGRGCTFACNFCYRMDKGFRPRSSDSIIREIRFLRDKYNITYISFFDELLMSSRQRTMELSQAIIDAKLDIHWYCNGRLNYAEPEILEKMKQAGCVFINYGIESLDNPTLEVMHKHLTRDMIVRGIENTLRAGISPGFNIIFGNIDEPLTAIDDAVEFLLKYDDHSQLRTIRPVTPYPGSELFDIAIQRGLLKNVEDFYENKHLNSDLLAVNFTKHSDDEVHAALHRANLALINRYIENQKAIMQENCRRLYEEKNINFRGFR